MVAISALRVRLAKGVPSVSGYLWHERYVLTTLRLITGGAQPYLILSHYTFPDEHVFVLSQVRKDFEKMRPTQTHYRESSLDLLRPSQETEIYRFLSLASHELKTPITTIRAYAQLLLHNLSRQSERTADPAA